MKIYKYLLCSLLLYISLNAFSQCSLNDLSTLQNWDWEVDDLNDPSYCNTWSAQILNYCAGNNNICLIGAPWNDPDAPDVIKVISRQQDYTREKGWVLLTRDFGKNGANTYPYFVLYNKFRGLIRTFFWLNSGVNQYNGVIVTMTHGLSKYGKSTAILSHTKEGSLGADDYLNSSTQFDEEIVYVSDPTDVAQDQWYVAEFRPTFDPNTQDGNFADATIEFTLSGIIQNNLVVNGDFRWQTAAQSDITNGRFSFSGNTTETSLPGDKIQKTINSVNKVFNTITEQNPGDIAESINKTSEFLYDLPITGHDNDRIFRLYELSLPIGGNFANSEIGETLSSIIGLASKGSTILGVMGSIVGQLWPGSDTESSTYSPTASEGTINLSGNIETTLPLRIIKIKTPGVVVENATNEELPIYDCPLGVVAVENSFNAEQIIYDRYVGEDYTTTPSGGFLSTATQKYKSLKGNSDIKIAVNQGFLFHSAKVAFLGKLTAAQMTDPNQFLLEDHERPPFEWRFNHTFWELETQRYHLTDYVEGNPLIFQTKYVDVNAFKDLTFNVKENTEVFVRVNVILLRDANNDGIPDNDVPFIYTNDYDLNIEAGTPDNINYANNSINALPPYSNITQGLNDGSGIVDAEQILTKNSSFQEATQRIYSQGNITILPQDGQQFYKAGGIIELNPGFTVEAGSNFMADTDYGYSVSIVSNIQPSQSTFNCEEVNPNANRRVGLLEENKENLLSYELEVYPNPTSENLVISKSFKNATNASISINDVQGKTIDSYNFEDVKSIDMKIDVKNYAQGLYIIKIIYGNESISKKVHVY